MNLDADVLDYVEDLPVSIWVEQENGYPVKCEMDLSGLMQVLMTKLYGAQLGEIHVRAVGSTTLRSFNAVEGLQPPSESELTRGKCMHPGCDRDQALSGDTSFCTLHSNTCLNCGRYIDEDALFCRNCSSSELARAMEE